MPLRATPGPRRAGVGWSGPSRPNLEVEAPHSQASVRERQCNGPNNPGVKSISLSSLMRGVFIMGRESLSRPQGTTSTRSLSAIGVMSG